MFRHATDVRALGARRKPLLGLLLVASLLAGAAGAGAVAGADTTVSPKLPGGILAPSGDLVRDSSVTLTVNPVAYTFYRAGTTATTTAAANYIRGDVPGLATAALVQSFLPPAFFPATANYAGCRGDDPAGPTIHGGSNNSPRSTVVVTGPGSATPVLTQVSPAITEVSLTGENYKVKDPQPTGANASNYRGGRPPTTSTTPPIAEPGRPWQLSLDLTGKPGGVYTVKTTTQNMVQQKAGSAYSTCTIGTPVQTAPGVFGNTVVPGPVVHETTFEYRPWQQTFTDLLGNGQVRFNTTPVPENQVRLGNVSGGIFSGAGSTQYFALPDGSSFALPSDPAACATNPLPCLPTGATTCDPTAGCVPRIAIIGRNGDAEALTGVFDLDSRAFIAVGRIGGTTRVLLSLGNVGDTYYHDVLAQLSAAAAAQGIDLAKILAMKVQANLNQSTVTLSLLNGLQIDPGDGTFGVHILGLPTTVQAGVLLNIAAGTSSKPCTSGSGDSDPTTPAPDRFTPSNGLGMTVERSDLLPEVPKVGAVGALVGGPIYHITGKYGSGLSGTSTAVIGLDTAAGEPSGYPVWISPVTGVNTASPTTTDFLGTATWLASTTSLGSAGCLHVGFMLGAGIQINDNLLPIGFGNLGIWDSNPTMAAINAQLTAVIAQVVDGVTADPTVAALLEQITGALPTGL